MTNKSDKPEVSDSDCLEAFDHLYAYINGELNDAHAAAMIEHHLSHCRSCFSRTEMEQALTARIRTSVRRESPALLRARVRKLIDKF